MSDSLWCYAHMLMTWGSVNIFMTFKSGHFTAIYDSSHILCFNRRILVYFVRGNNTLLTSCLTGLDLNISKEDESKVNEEASQSTVILPLTKSVCSIRCFNYALFRQALTSCDFHRSSIARKANFTSASRCLAAAWATRSEDIANRYLERFYSQIIYLM